MPDNKKGFTFDDFVNMGAQSQGSQFGQFGGATPTAPIEQFVIPEQEAPIVNNINQPDIKGAYDSVFSEQTRRNYIEESAKLKATETVNYAEQAFGLGGSLNFNDTGAKREVLRFIGAKPDAQSVNYQVNREATQKARSGGDPNAIIYDFNVEDAKGNEYEIKGVSANALSELFARLRKPEEGKEAVLTDSPRRVRRKGEDWRLDIESPLEEGLVSIEKTSDFERDLSEFGSRALSGIRGAAADLTTSALQGATRAASYIAMPNQKMGLQRLADSEIFSDPKQRAQDLVEQKGFENPFLAAGASGVGSVATIAPLGAAGLVGAAAGSFESGVQKSRELSARNGEPQSDMRDVAMGLGYGAVEFLAERVGLQSIKRAINPTAARKIGEKMINEAITSNPNILPRLFQAAKGTGTAAAVNYAEEFATNLGQEGINNLFYEVDRDLWQTLQDANMAGIGGAFGGGVASVTGQIGQSLSGKSNIGLSDQENYAVNKLQRLGFTEQDALEEVIANRTGQKANTESRKQILQEFPESQAAVDGLLNKAKKVYGDSAAKVRNLFGGAREEMDASVDEQIAAAETILSPEPVAEPSVEELPVAEDAPIQEQQVDDLPITEEVPVMEQPAPTVDDFQEPSDLDFTDEDIDELAADDIEPVITEEAQAEEALIENTEAPVQEKAEPVNIGEVTYFIPRKGGTIEKDKPVASNSAHLLALNKTSEDEATVHLTIGQFGQEEVCLFDLLNGGQKLIGSAILVGKTKHDEASDNTKMTEVSPGIAKKVNGKWKIVKPLEYTLDDNYVPRAATPTQEVVAKEELSSFSFTPTETSITGVENQLKAAAAEKTGLSRAELEIRGSSVIYSSLSGKTKDVKVGSIDTDRDTLSFSDADIENAEDETVLGSFDEEAINPLMRIAAIKSSLKGFEFSVGALTASARKSTLINIAAQKLGIDKSLLKIEGGAINYSTPDGKKIKVATVEKGRKLTFNEQDIDNYVSETAKERISAKLTESRKAISALRENNKKLAQAGKNIPNLSPGSLRKKRQPKEQPKDIPYEEVAPNSQEGSQPGKRRRTAAQRAKDALDDAIKDNIGVSLVPGLSASTLLKIIRAAGVKMNHLAVKALDKYIDLKAQAVNEGRTTLAQAVANVKEYLSNGVAKGVSFIADKEITELITATVNDIPKRAEREKQKAAGKAKYEENMSKAEKNKAIKEQKKKADTVVKNIVKKANKGEIKGHNEITILESILKLDERLGVSKAYLRQSFNDAVAELRNPTTTNIGRATVVDARNYVKKYANALLESNKNDLIKNRLVTQILNSIDKINSYASVIQQLEVIKNIMTKANYANRLRDAQRELAKAVKARMSTPGLADLVKFMRVSIKISNVQDLETLEKLTELAKKISETRTPGASLIKEFFDLYSSLKMPIPDTKETKEKDGKGKEGPSTKEIDESREASIKAIERVLKLGGYNPLETLRAMLGEDIASKTYKAIEAIKKYKTDSVKDFNYIVTFFNNVADIYESSIKGTGVTFNEYLMQQFATKEGFDTTNTILRLQARAAEEEMLESNVDKVVDGVAKLFDYKNKTLAGKIVFGEWLGKNTKRTFQQTIDRLVNYSSDASIAIEKAIRLPLLSAFTKAELRSQRILHNISEQIAKSKLEKSTYIHFQVLGMTLDYLNGDQKSHSYDAFVQNAIDIRRKIQNGTKDKNSRNQRDAKEGLAWFDKNIGKISDDLKNIEGPVANKVKALDGKPVNKESDYVALIRTVLPSSLTLLFQNNFALNFSELGAEVRAVSMMYKGETPDERPFYWPRKAIGRIDAGRVNNESDVAVSIEDFDDYDQYAKKIETILNNGLDGAKFGQISSRTNPHSLARTQNENLVYSLNAFDVASSFFTRATADVYVTPELFKINKILGTESRKVFKGEGSTALRDAVILLSRSAYNVGYKKLSNPLLKSIDPLIGEASRQMLGSYFQLYKQAIPPVTSYLLSGEGDLVQRFIALKSVLGNKENLAILGDIAATRVTKAKEQLKKKYERIGEQTGLDFGVSRSNAVIDSFRELSAQQGGGNWVETLGDNIEKSKLGFIVRQSRVSSEYLPTADSYARLIIYAAEIERRSGMKFDEFMTRRKFTPADEKIVALADKQVNRVMGSSFSKERSAALTMNSNSEYENLWKKINYFMSNALAQNSTTFKDSLQAAILDPENRAEHAKRAGLITANAMVFSGVGIGISSLLAGIASGLGTLALGEEDEEEEKDSFARSLIGTAAGWTKDLFFGNSGNFINMLVTWAINLTDYSVKKATQMSDEEKLALIMKTARQYEANRMNDKQLVEELKNIQEQARISERTLLYQGAKSYGKTAELRPFVNLSGPYKGFINTPLDIIDLVYKEVDTKEGVKEKDMLKLASNFSKQVPFVQTDLSKVLQLTLKELQKERKPDGKEQNRR